MSISKIFYETLGVFSQMKETNISDVFFYSVPWFMHQGWYFGALGVPRGVTKPFFKHGHVEYQIDGDDEQNRMQVTFSSSRVKLVTLRRGQKVKNNYHVNFKDFIPNFVCVLTNKR